MYLKQPPPGLTPELFAPGLVSKADEREFGAVFSEDGREFFYAVDVNGKAEIRHTKQDGARWKPPQPLIDHDQYGYNDPFLSPDEQRLYFISDQPLSGVGPPKDIDIWYAEREGDTWSSPTVPNARKATVGVTCTSAFALRITPGQKLKTWVTSSIPNITSSVPL